MKFNNRNAQELYFYLYWFYLGASVFCFLLEVVLLLIFNLSGFDDINVWSLYLLIIIMIGAFYFRMNAFHYHRILIDNENRGEGIEESIRLSSTLGAGLFSKLKKKVGSLPGDKKQQKNTPQKKKRRD